MKASTTFFSVHDAENIASPRVNTTCFVGEIFHHARNKIWEEGQKEN